MSTENNCFFCNTKCEVFQTPDHHLANTYRCKYCGEYILLQKGLSEVYDIREPSDKFKIACILNERRLKKLVGIAFDNKTNKEKKICGFPLVSVGDILDEFPKKASDFLNRTLLNLSRLTAGPFDCISRDDMKENEHLLLFNQNRKTRDAFLLELAEQGFIRFNIGSSTLFILTTKFWEMVENLQKTEVGNKRAFVAMWFDKSMDDYYK